MPTNSVFNCRQKMSFGFLSDRIFEYRSQNEGRVKIQKCLLYLYLIEGELINNLVLVNKLYGGGST